MAPHSNHVATSALVLHLAFSITYPAHAFIGGGPITGVGPHPASPAWRCRSNRLTVAASSPKGPPGQKKPPAAAAPNEETAIAREEDERKTARWGVSLTPARNKDQNPLKAVTSSIRIVRDGVTAAKDAVYEAADVAGTLIESTQKGTRRATADGKASLSSRSINDGVGGDAIVSSDKSQRGDGDGGAIAVLKAVGAGAVFVKDAVWESIELLGEAADAARSAPDVAKSAVETSKAALKVAKGNVKVIVTAPARTVDAISGAVDSAGRAATGVKDRVYGAADAVASLASVPAAIAERQRRAQQERDEEAAEAALARRETASRLDGAVSGAKAAVWGTVEGVETLVDTVTSAPAAVESGLARAQEAVKTTGDLVQSIPRTVQQIPVEAQRKVDDVRKSVTSTRSAADALVAGVRDGIGGAAALAQRVADEATGKAQREREEVARLAELKAREEALKKKERDAIIRIKGEPYTAEDLAKKGVELGVEAAKGTAKLSKGAAWVAGKAWTAPGEATRTVLRPVYEYQQSRRRVQEAIAKQGSRRPVSPPPSRISTTSAPSPSSPSYSPQPDRPGVELPPSSPKIGSPLAGSPIGESPTEPPPAEGSPKGATAEVYPVEGSSPATESPATTAAAAEKGDKDTRQDYRPAWKKPRAESRK